MLHPFEKSQTVASGDIASGDIAPFKKSQAVASGDVASGDAASRDVASGDFVISHMFLFLQSNL